MRGHERCALAVFFVGALSSSLAVDTETGTQQPVAGAGTVDHEVVVPEDPHQANSSRIRPSLPRSWASVHSNKYSDINGSVACKDAIRQHCSSTQPGVGRVAHCLRAASRAAAARKEKSGVSFECVKDMSAFFRTMSGVQVRGGALPKFPRFGAFVKDQFRFEPVLGLNAACVEETKTYCDKFPSGPPLLVCLKKHKLELGESCRSKVFDGQRLEAEDISLDKAFMEACSDDLNKIPACKVRGRAGSHKACLQKHRSELSNKCLEGVFRREKDDAEDIRLNLDVLKTCSQEVAGVCKDIRFGEARMLKCLWDESLKPNSGSFSQDCKEKVQAVVAHSVQDYRLDFRIHSRCEKDIDALCAEERARVDRLSIAELLGGEGSSTDSLAGEVLQCLKKNLPKLDSRACQMEVQRVVKIHSVSAKADARLGNACSNDIVLLCDGVKADHVHMCLRNNIGRLSPACKAAELVQGAAEAGSIVMKPFLMNSCRPAIAKFCDKVPPGFAAVIRCLQDHMDDPNFPARCKQEVEQDLEASNHDWRLKFGISHTCQPEVEKLCPADARVGAGAVLDCLHKNVQRIQQAMCKDEILRFAKSGASNIKFAPTVYAKCVDDVHTFCVDVKPGGGRVHNCLFKHRKDISQDCAAAEFQNQAIQAADIRAHPKAMQVCASSIDKLCKDVHMGEGRVWACLEQAKDNPEMAGDCVVVVKEHINLKHTEFNLNPLLSKLCVLDARQLCPNEMIAADAKDFTSDGKVMTCLMGQAVAVTNMACKASLRRKTSQRVANFQLDPLAKLACAKDVATLCSSEKDKGSGLEQTCLQRNIQKLSDACRKKQMFYMGLGSSDIRISADLSKACASAQKTFCSDEHEGGGRVILCLLDNMHHKEIEPSCRKALVAEQQKRRQGIEFNPALMNNCQKDIDALEKNGTCKQAHGGGTRIECLTRNADKIKDPSCHASVERVMRFQSADLRAKPGMETACKQDIERLCKGIDAGAGRWHSCLRNNISAVQSPECKAMVEEVKKQDQTSFYVNYDVHTHCASERTAFCKDATVGRARVLDCLYFHKSEEGFSNGCYFAVMSSALTSKLAKSTLGEKLKGMRGWLDGHRGTVEKWGGIIIAVAVCTSAISAFGFSYWLLKKKFKKLGYSVTVPSASEE